MINFIKRFWKYLVLLLCIIIISIIGYITYKNQNNISTSSTKKLLDINIKTTTITTTNKSIKTIFVDVKGAVNNPGVYEIEDGKRIIDAINIAGGLTNKADTSNLNLSKKVLDESYIIVYTKYELYSYKNDNTKCIQNECICPDLSNTACIATTTSAVSSNSKSLISINTASKEELMTLTGVGESKANAIINYRQENGNFKSIEDIKNVAGIGDSMYLKIKDYITI